MKERALRMGKPIPLIGVSSEPDDFDPGRPVLLLLNSGVMHHVGACRLSVKIARAAAERGILAVRFDFSGIGDSEPRRGSEVFEEASRNECREVMDYLQKSRGVNQFILYGLCSGADAAYYSALVDDRVIGFAQIDAYCYTTWRYYFEYYWPLLLNSKRWRSFLRNQFKKMRGKTRKLSPGEAAGVEDQYFEIPTYTRVFPPREEVAAGLKKLIEQGVKMSVHFTGGEPDYNYTQQYRDSFRDVKFGDQLDLHYYPDTNHIVTQPAYQAQIVENIVSWAVTVAVAARRTSDSGQEVVSKLNVSAIG